MAQIEFEKLLADYGELFARVAATYEANPSKQQELVQEICLAVWQGLTRFEAKSSLKTYVLRIAHNRAVTHVNKEVKEPSEQAKTDSDDEVLALAAHTPSAEAQLAQQQQAQLLVALVRQLPVASRQVITLSMEGVSYQEIADICGISQSNVGVLISRAKQQLKEKMHAKQ